jgi:hypothetical protein
MYVYPYPFWLKEFIAGLHAIMELSLVGAFAVVVLCNPFLLLRTYDFWGLHGIMELSLFGAFVALLLCNPFLLVHTYDFWACFGGVCLYFAVVAIIYEVVLSFLFSVVPNCVQYLCQTRLDAKLPLRACLCFVVLFCRVWHVSYPLVPTGHMAHY